MLIEQIIESWAWAPGRAYIPKTEYFYDKTKISKASLRVNYLILKLLQKAIYLVFQIAIFSKNYPAAVGFATGPP